YAEGKRIINEKFKEEFSNIEVSMSLGYLKSVNVFVLGEVTKPGVYDLTFLSNPLAAFFQSEGIKKSGSLRKIQYISSNGTTKTIDLYKLFVKAKPLPHIQFSSGDMIVVPPIGKVVGINGEVNRPGIYELEGNEQLSSLIEMAGGLLPTAGTKRINIERITSTDEKISEDLKFENLNDLEKISRNTEIKNGDLITVTEIPPYLHNYVEIKGNVNSEGTYQLKEGMTVLDLLKEAGYTKKELEEEFYVNVGGEVEKPGQYLLYPGMTVGDLLFAARKFSTSENEAELFRLDPEKGFSIEKINLNNPDDLQIKLKPIDYLSVKRKIYYGELGYVNVVGEIKHPGTYPIQVGTTLGEIIERAGGFTEKAYIEAAIFTKKSVQELQKEALEDLIKETRLRLLAEQRAIMGSFSSEEDKLAQMKYIQLQETQLESLKKIQNPGRVVIDLRDPNQLSIPLGVGDKIEVPRLTGTVQIIGEVYNVTGIAYKEGLSLNDYLEIAGGPKPTANTKEIYIRRASGEVEKGYLRSASGKIGGSVKIKPGDTIIVPEKVKIGVSPLEALGFTVDILYKVGLTVAAFVAIMR
ncbi:MAG: SLBB domain-containing protein, partial [candidate division WOR-3 bacterium]